MSRKIYPSLQLTIAHVKLFAPCTSNLDPYLRKAIREQRGGEPLIDLSEQREEEDSGDGTVQQDPFGPLKETVGSEAVYVFDDPMTWAGVQKSLVQMDIGEIGWVYF